MRPDLNTPEENPVVSVSALVRQMKFLLESQFPYLWVEGEVTNLRIPSSGHAYFSLKDENAEIPAVMFRSSHAQLAFDLNNGDRIQCAGKITLYEAQGKAQIVVQRARPVGAGHLLAAFEALKKKLLAEGLQWFFAARDDGQVVPPFGQRATKLCADA